MAAEAALLEAFCQVPTLGRGWCFPAAGNSGGEGGVRVALQTAQRNLPANAQRKFVTHLQARWSMGHGGVQFVFFWGCGLLGASRPGRQVCDAHSGEREQRSRPLGQGPRSATYWEAAPRLIIA